MATDKTIEIEFKLKTKEELGLKKYAFKNKLFRNFKVMFPQVLIFPINIRDFEKSTYSKKEMV
jgi:hypothetical protein